MHKREIKRVTDNQADLEREQLLHRQRHKYNERDREGKAMSVETKRHRERDRGESKI
jgi:hypothetical protein